MANKINLDALIPREDFEVKASVSQTRKTQDFKITDLEASSFFMSPLRKPDFQRETNEWDESRVISIIESFLNADLIPAVILWKNSAGFTFVIDGAHRISALAAWVNDDYGDGDISKAFYDGKIPDTQLDIAARLRLKINKKVQPYSDYVLAMKSPDKVKPEVVNTARLLGSLAIQIQWVDGDAKKAETSFFKINQKAAPIDKTEFILLEARNKANGIATRAILRAGKGHKYWSSFSNDVQNEIQQLAEEINENLFKPSFKTPLKTLDIPVAGQNFSSQSQMLVLEFVNAVNNIDDKVVHQDDIDGNETLNVLKKCLAVSRLINSKHPSSLGLHPAVYFYAKNGRYKPASFNFFLHLVMNLKSRNKLNDFTKAREKLERIIIDFDDFPRQIVRKYRTAKKGTPHVVNFYLQLISHINSGTSTNDAISIIMKSPEFNYLTTKVEEVLEGESADFDSDGKSQVFMDEALESAIKCKICNGFLHRNSISVDHIERKRDGGLGNVQNGQLSHPYCNTGFKN